MRFDWTPREPGPQLLALMHESSKDPSLLCVSSDAAKRTLGFKSALRGAILTGSAALFEFRSKQPDGDHTRGAHRIDHAGNHREFDWRLTANKSRTIGAKLENLAEPGFQRVPRNRSLIDAQRSVRENLNNHDPVRRTFHERIRLRNRHVQSLLVMGNYHKNDQQHQQNVDQWNDIDVRENTAIAPTEGNAHESPRFCSAADGQNRRLRLCLSPREDSAHPANSY